MNCILQHSWTGLGLGLDSVHCVGVWCWLVLSLFQRAFKRHIIKLILYSFFGFHFVMYDQNSQSSSQDGDVCFSLCFWVGGGEGG